MARFFVCTEQVRETVELSEDGLEERIAALVSDAVTALGYDVVRVQLTGPGRSTLQLMVERSDRGAMTVEDCAAVSRVVSELLDAADPIAASFTLEVSSPGLDRPLMTIEHYRRFIGFEARVELASALEGRRRFTGRIVSVDEGGADAAIVLETDQGPVRLSYRTVRKGKLVMNDDLLEAAHAWAAAGRSP